jgi:hypothetical protein
MMNLAQSLDNGTAKGAKPSPYAFYGSTTTMVVTEGLASIVYDSEHIK